MKKVLQSAIIQFQENDALDFSKTEKLLNLNKNLYEKVKLQFFKTCKICYEINTIDSFCNCKIECAVICLGCEEFSMFDTSIDCKNNGFNRTDLIQFMAIYENTEIKLKEDKLFFKNALDGCFNDDLIEQNNKKDLNKPAIITVQQFMKEQGYVSIHKTVRKNQEGLPYLTFIKVDNVAHNIYFSKEAGQDKQAGQLIYKGFFDKLNVAEVTNAAGEVRMKIVDESFDFSKANEIPIPESQGIEKKSKTNNETVKNEPSLFLGGLGCLGIVFLYFAFAFFYRLVTIPDYSFEIFTNNVFIGLRKFGLELIIFVAYILFYVVLIIVIVHLYQNSKYTKKTLDSLFINPIIKILNKYGINTSIKQLSHLYFVYYISFIAIFLFDLVLTVIAYLISIFSFSWYYFIVLFFTVFSYNLWKEELKFKSEWKTKASKLIITISIVCFLIFVFNYRNHIKVNPFYESKFLNSEKE